MKTRTEWANLLRATIRRSGLSASAYAREILLRDPRTLRRWVSGKSPIPQAIRDHLNPKGND